MLELFIIKNSSILPMNVLLVAPNLMNFERELPAGVTNTGQNATDRMEGGLAAGLSCCMASFI